MDAEGTPAYLESTNPDNNARYEKLGSDRWASSRRRMEPAPWRRCGGIPGHGPGPLSGPEKIAVIDAAYAALAEGGLDEFLDCWADDLDHRAIEGAPDDPGPIHGRDAMRAYIQDWMDTFDGFEVQPIELIDGGGTVVVAMRYGGRARLSGVTTDSTYGVVFSIRDGKIARGREYATRTRPSRPPGSTGRPLADLVVEAEDRQVHRDHDEARRRRRRSMIISGSISEVSALTLASTSAS